MKRNFIASLLFVCAVILAAASCGRPHTSETSNDTTKKGPSPPVEIKDPIISMMMASSVDDKGKPVNPQFSFPQTDKQITAIVQLGNIKGSQLTVTWYKTSDDGDEKLFEHQIEVKSRDRAFSVAKNPGMFFLAGTYKVVATLGGQTKEMEFDITPPKAAPKKTSDNRDERHFASQTEFKNDRAVSIETNSDGLLQAISYELVSDQSQVRKVASNQSPQSGPAQSSSSTAAPGQPPVAGSSGTIPPWVTPSGVCIGGGDEDMCGPEILDSTAPFVDLYVDNPSDQVVNVQGGLFQGGAVAEDQLSPVRTIAPAHSQEFVYNPCYYWYGSDLPGAKFRFFVSTTSTDVTLGNDTSDPTVKVISTPARGTKVRTGDKINLKVTANEQRSGGSWQTGVKVIQITAEPGGLVKDPWVNPSNLPKACDDKTWEQKDEATYTVPKDPPPIIKICVIAEDYAGNQGVKCGEFRTGNKWNGKFHLVSSVSNFNETWDGKFSVVVGANGDVQGKGSAHRVAAQCPWGNNATKAEFDVRGTFKRSQFQLAFSETAMDGPNCGLANYTFFLDPEFISIGGSSRSPSGFTVPVIAPGDAEAKLSNSATVTNRAVGRGQITITMLCEDCQ